MVPLNFLPPRRELFAIGIRFIQDFGCLKYILITIIILHFCFGVFIPPLFTTDLLRNLFYGKFFWHYGFDVYDMTPVQLDPQYNVVDPFSGLLAHPLTSFNYPTIQLLFWAFVALFSLPLFIIKWIFSLIDIINVFFMSNLIKNKNWGDQGRKLDAGIFFLSYLVLTLPLSAIEGQPVAFTVFFVLFPLNLHPNHRKLSYLFIGLGFHWKYVPIILLPYFVIIDSEQRRQTFLNILLAGGTILLLSFPILFSGFVFWFFGYLLVPRQYTKLYNTNPFLLEYLTPSSLMSTAILGLAIFTAFDIPSIVSSRTLYLSELRGRTHWVPFIILSIFLKIYPTAWPWYWVWYYPTLVLLPQNKFNLFCILTGGMLGIAAIDFIRMTKYFQILLPSPIVDLLFLLQVGILISTLFLVFLIYKSSSITRKFSSIAFVDSIFK
ncbi:MAG: hypothetical protein ACFFE8_03230 [Candidatus Heimdallarchaeota archaeon]